MNDQLQEELNWINYISEKTNNKKLVLFDVGAHTFHVAATFKQSFPLSIVYSFEPSPSNIKKYSYIRKYIDINIFPLALSDKDGVATFYECDNQVSGSIMSPVVKPDSNIHAIWEDVKFNLDGIKVQTTSLETFCNKNNITRIDYLHMDVQGAEHLVIKGMSDNCKPLMIYTETAEFNTYHTGMSLELFDNLMMDKGYEMVQRYQYDTLYKLKGSLI